MQNSSRTGKIMIIVGIVLTLAFVAWLVITNLQNKTAEPTAAAKFISSTFAPFIPKRPDNKNPGQDITIPDQNVPITVSEVDPLVQLTDFPVTSYKLVYAKAGEPSYDILTVDKSLGYIYQITSQPEPTRSQLSTTLIQKIGEVAFGRDKQVYARYYDTDAFKYEAFFGQLMDSVTKVTCPTTFSTVAVGATGRDVEDIQYYLGQYLTNATNFAYKPGIFDAETKKMVQEFQKTQKLNASGILDTKTLQALTNLCTDQERKKRAEELDKNHKPRYTLDGRPITGEVHTVITNPDATQLYFVKTTLQGIRGSIRDLTQTVTDREIYFLPFIEWQTSWPEKNTITLTTKPAGTVAGYFYFLNTLNGSLNKMLSGIKGLTTKTSSDLVHVLVGKTTASAYTISLYTLQTGAEPKVEPMQMRTFPEKCAFNNATTKIFCMVPESIPQGLYPDVWYQSLVNFTDELWEIDLSPTRYKVLNRFSQNKTPQSFDSVDLTVDSTDTYLYFVDQKTGFLWRYELSK